MKGSFTPVKCQCAVYRVKDGFHCLQQREKKSETPFDEFEFTSTHNFYPSRIYTLHLGCPYQRMNLFGRLTEISNHLCRFRGSLGWCSDVYCL